MKPVYLFLILFLLCSCTQEPEEVRFWKISNAAISEERIAVLMDKQPNILNIIVKGNTDAPFQIVANGTSDNKIYQFKGGEVDTVLSDYWRSPICRTLYVPKGVTNGDVNISVLLYSKDQ